MSYKSAVKWRKGKGARWWKNYMMYRRHGVMLEFVEHLYEKQRGLCALCGRVLPPLFGHAKSRNVCLDNNHVTNDVRGLIHRRRNQILGFVENLPISLDAFVAYIHSSVGVKVTGKGATPNV